MTPKIKDRGPRPSKLPAPYVGAEYPSFSFRHMTTNKSYTFEYFNDTHEAKEASYSFLSKLIESSRHKISELLLWDKKRGFETIPHNRFRNKIFVEGLALPDDAKLHILRVGGNHDYRIVCFKQPNALGLFYIVLFDFDHSTYDHG